MATIKQLQTLFSKLGYEKEARIRRIYGWTTGKKTSSKELDPDELSDLVTSLKDEVTERKKTKEKIILKTRHVILDIATRCGIKKPSGWQEFNHFMLHKSVVKKDLRLCSLDQLEAVEKQFRAIETNNARSAEKPGTKAWHNKFGGVPSNN